MQSRGQRQDWLTWTKFWGKVSQKRLLLVCRVLKDGLNWQKCTEHLKQRENHEWDPVHCCHSIMCAYRKGLQKVHENMKLKDQFIFGAKNYKFMCSFFIILIFHELLETPQMKEYWKLKHTFETRLVRSFFVCWPKELSIISQAAGARTVYHNVDVEGLAEADSAGISGKDWLGLGWERLRR